MGWVVKMRTDGWVDQRHVSVCVCVGDQMDRLTQRRGVGGWRDKRVGGCVDDQPDKEGRMQELKELLTFYSYIT
jgi:hypothetical protein